jgi:predicted DNA-binding protein with PD1-like motif
MKAKFLNEQPERTIVVAFEEGEEAAEGLLRFAKEQNLTAARFTAIGALSSAELGYFDVEKREYAHIELHEQVEVLSMIGNIARYGAETKVHAHLVLGKRDGTAHGGHLLKAVVRPTLEVILVESPAYLRREVDESCGLPLISV